MAGHIRIGIITLPAVLYDGDAVNRGRSVYGIRCVGKASPCRAVALAVNVGDVRTALIVMIAEWESNSVVICISSNAPSPMPAGVPDQVILTVITRPGRELNFGQPVVAVFHIHCNRAAAVIDLNADVTVADNHNRIRFRGRNKHPCCQQHEGAQKDGKCAFDS